VQTRPSPRLLDFRRTLAWRCGNNPEKVANHFDSFGRSVLVRSLRLLIDASTQPIDWSAYRDDRAEQLAALVEATLQGRSLTPVVEAKAPVLPLLEALQQTVAAALRDQIPADTVASRGRSRKKPRRAKASPFFFRAPRARFVSDHVVLVLVVVSRQG